MYVSAFYEGISFIDSCILFEGIQEAAAVLLLPCLLREKGGNTEDFIKICMVWLIPCIIEIHIHNLQEQRNARNVPTFCFKSTLRFKKVPKTTNVKISLRARFCLPAIISYCCFANTTVDCGKWSLQALRELDCKTYKLQH